MFDPNTRPPTTPDTPPLDPPGPRNSVVSIVSMVFGILSMPGFAFGCCCPPVSVLGAVCGLAAVITGHLGLHELKKHPERAGQGFAVTGLILGYLALLVCVAGAILFALGILTDNANSTWNVTTGP